ncbi:beta-1,4-N-acetylglucosaminyltransferase [Strigomonas culicis]|uniref:UDP-N-acetylglucosamine transferase subunit ALG14 n=1 Tax=Strigomonas culicis TaxID=28005 RepID=S9UCI3_9TRYP|nr:beta-1,4-N-acetylglucosaminyltransferase [Strigomonas culicis]|eukprot:EPY28522.1 beta-1,4-N-acetylglucosaminyltransferase [Strigomonas culicis]
MILAILETVVVCLACAVLARSYYVLRVATPAALRPHVRGPMKVCVVLGSGGHTSEMLRAIEALPRGYWRNNRCVYVVSDTDRHSAALAAELEQRLFGRAAACCVIPRAREVGQSYFTSIFTTLRGVYRALAIVYNERPSVLLLNGPGVCVPIVAASLALAVVCPWRCARPATVYMESFTCVSHLSLTGALLAPFATDVFTVHWRRLEAGVRRRMWRGALRYIGCEGAANAPRLAEADGAAAAARYAVVTVGSTHFDALVRAVLQEDVCALLRTAHGIDKLYVQYGTMPCPLPAATAACGGLEVEVFPYRAGLGALLARAALVLTHAGAGTILECLHAHRRLLVVPNRELMSDHQLELAEVLEQQGYLFCVDVADLPARLRALDCGPLRQFPGLAADLLAEAVSLPLTGERWKKDA